MVWPLAEDAALKKKLTGLSVTGSAVPKPIKVEARFAVPEDEFEDFTYPLIMIRQAAVTRASEREFSGFSQMLAVPEGMDPNGGPYFGNYPTPHDIDYQVDLYTRLESHRVQLIGALAQFDYLPQRFGYLDMPGDATVRRLDMVGVPELSSGRDRDNKRLFSAQWRIRVSTELFLLGDPHTIPDVERVEIDAHYAAPGSGDD